MSNFLYVIEYNSHPQVKTINIWTPIMALPEWNKAMAKQAAKDRANETGKASKHYRVRKYISEE